MNPTRRNVAAKQPEPLPGVIDSIADGLTMALTRPLLLIVPMLLDLYYWVGWKISISALTSPLSRWTLDTDADGAADVAKQLTKIGNSDVSWLLSLFVPSLLSDVKRSDLYNLGQRPLLKPSEWWVDLPILTLAILGTALLFMIYAVPLADAAVNRGRPWRETIRAIVIAWWRLLGLLAACVGIGLLLLGPFTIGSIALLIVGINAAPLLGGIAIMVGFAAYVMLWFAPDAIVVSQVGPLRAMKYSYAMVRSFFWQTVGLGGASVVISLGLGELWRRLAENAPGLLIGVTANAFFATGLVIASLSFYAKRIQILKPGSV